MHLDHVYVLFTCSSRRVEGPHGQVEMNERGQFGFGLKKGAAYNSSKDAWLSRVMVPSCIPYHGVLHLGPRNIGVACISLGCAGKREAIDEQNTCTLLPYLIFPGQLQSSCAFSGRAVRFSIPSSSRQHSAARPAEAQSAC